MNNNIKNMNETLDSKEKIGVDNFVFDEDIIRIKVKIREFTELLNTGYIGMIIKTVINWTVTLEISNGKDKLTIQDILKILNERINKLNEYFNELCYIISNFDKSHDNDKYEAFVKEQKLEFRQKVYKLFDLEEIVNDIIINCVAFGSKINFIKRVLGERFFNEYTYTLVDSVLFTETQDEFETKIYQYINDRVVTIENTVDRKLAKISILNAIMSNVIKEKANVPTNVKNDLIKLSVDMKKIEDDNKVFHDGMIELQDKKP